MPHEAVFRIVNEEIDRMRHAATFALLSRKDVIIVASVSCIYGIGAREAYSSMTVELQVGKSVPRDAIMPTRNGPPAAMKRPTL